MLDVLNRYGHGFVATPTILACRNAGVFELLAGDTSLTTEDLAEKLAANSGHLQAALRLLESLGWIARTDNRLSLLVSAAQYNAVPPDVLDWWSFPLSAYLSGGTPDLAIRPWLDRCRASWTVSDQNISQLIDGVFVVPILTALHQSDLLQVDSESPQFAIRAKTQLVRSELAELFTHFGWAHDGIGTNLELTDLGRFLIDRALILGTLRAYTPMLSRLGELLTGNAEAVFRRDELGHEQHVERTLNVVASGFQHEKYFVDVDAMISSIFDQQPIETQPKQIVDMGCGDGSFLKRIYQHIETNTVRGGALADHPLQMIGVDFNEKALQATDENLRDIPHLVLKGDVGEPGKLVDDLRAVGIADPSEVLHVRSFLDHDRPFREPRDDAALRRRYGLPYEGVFVDRQGTSVQPARAIQSLVEHLASWAEVTTSHGLIVLEVHCLPPQVTGRFFEQSESLHFDAYHAYSMQYLVEADLFQMCAAEVGLFSKHGHIRRYPKTLPFCRITLSSFEKRPYTVRHASADDVTAISELLSLFDNSQVVPTDQWHEIIGAEPFLGYLMEDGDRVVGAAICLRVLGLDDFVSRTQSNLLSVHDRRGDTWLILEAVIHPDYKQRTREFLRFILEQASLKAGIEQAAAIVPCHGYNESCGKPLDEYVHSFIGQRATQEPVVEVHDSLGGVMFGVLPTAGSIIQHPCVLMRHDTLGPRSPNVQRHSQSDPTAAIASDMSQIVSKMVQQLMEGNGSVYSPDKTFYELGLDSLDHMELATSLAKTLGTQVDSGVLIEFSTPRKLGDHLRGQISGASKGRSIRRFLQRRTS